MSNQIFGRLLKALFGAERCFERQNGTQMDFMQAEANDASVAEEGQGKAARPYVGSLQVRLFQATAKSAATIWNDALALRAP